MTTLYLPLQKYKLAQAVKIILRRNQVYNWLMFTAYYALEFHPTGNDATVLDAPVIVDVGEAVQTQLQLHLGGRDVVYPRTRGALTWRKSAKFRTFVLWAVGVGLATAPPSSLNTTTPP